MDGDFGSNGLMARTAAGTYASRTITGTASQITVNNGDGVSGNPTISLAVVPGFGACRAHRNSTNQTGVTNGVNIEWTTEDFDPDNCFDLANDQFKPTVAGYYAISVQMSPSAISPGTFANVNIVKNSTIVASSAGTGPGNRVGTFCLIQMNGSTDAVTIPVFTDGTVTVSGGINDTFVSAHLVRA